MAQIAAAGPQGSGVKTMAQPRPIAAAVARRGGVQCGQADQRAAPHLPQFVKDEFDAFRECGILARASGLADSARALSATPGAT